jgi:prepilin-type N-terminal cleavage/methylation domain-containing protein
VSVRVSGFRRRRRHLGSERGYSLTELITAMVILGIVLGALTAMFQAGMTAQVRANKELDAQRNARAALDRMRRELHCANAISAPNGTAVATVVVTLPTACPGSDTTVTYTATNVATNRWSLARTGSSGTPVDVADYLTSGTIFTYYVPASGTLGRLRVDLPVDLDPSDTGTSWRLQDDIVLRNTTRL